MLLKLPPQLLQEKLGLFVIRRADVIVRALFPVLHEVFVPQEKGEHGDDVQRVELLPVRGHTLRTLTAMLLWRAPCGYNAAMRFPDR